MKSLPKVIISVFLLFLVISCKEKAEGIKAIKEGNEVKMGMFVDEKLSGLGLIANESNTIEAVGSWKGGVIDGLGMRVNKVFTDIGEFTNGAMNGKGIKKSTTGDVYMGSFVADSYQGKGVMFYSDGRTYSGAFVNNSPEGAGIMQSPGGKIYIGMFKNGMYEGDGVLFLGTGERWEGKFVRNEPSPTAKFYDRR